MSDLVERILRIWFRVPRRRAFHLKPERLNAVKEFYGTDTVRCFFAPLTELGAK
jgi:hypothetical protein